MNWRGTWVWRLGANSRHGFAYQIENPTQVADVCAHFHRTERTATRCGEQIAKRLNAEVPA